MSTVNCSGCAHPLPLAFAAIFLLGTSAPVLAEEPLVQPTCGVDNPCLIAEGEYRIRFPAGWDGITPLGAIVFLHGWQGTAAGEMRNPAWSKLADRLNVAFIAPQGLGKTWSYPGSPRSMRDEFSFFEALVSDLTHRFPIRKDRLMASGFSMGGSMVWNIACHRSTLFAGYAPIAGAFWDPIPAECPSPTPVLYHVHGTSDRTVPLSGRPIGDRWHQSDVAKSLAVWQLKAALPQVFPKDAPADGFNCQRQEGPATTATRAPLLEICLHSGGHSIRASWVERAWRNLAKHLNWEDATR